MRGMNNPPFRVTGQAGSRDGLHILHVSGALTSATAAEFHSAVVAVTAPRLVIDMSEVSHIDSMAIGGLVRAYVACQKSGRKLALAGLNHRVKNVLNLTGVEPLFDTYATIGEAEAALA